MKNIDNFNRSYIHSLQQVPDAVNPLEVAALFEENHVSYVLIGGHMISYYTENVRATVDVDFLVADSDFLRAVGILDRAYTRFKQHDGIYHVTYDSKEKNLKNPERIDLVKSDFPLFKNIIQTYCLMLQCKEQQIKIPTIEAAIALKFAACISPNRGDEDKPVDHADLLGLIRSKQDFNKNVLFNLGELIYSGGGRELLSVVENIANGRPITL